MEVMSMDPLSPSLPLVSGGTYQIQPPLKEQSTPITDGFQHNTAAVSKEDQGYKKMTLAESAPVARADVIDTNSYPRKMTDQEKKDFREYFTALDVDKAVVSGPATPEYNCISWTVGETHQWFWPPSMYPSMDPEAAFDKFMGNYGYAPAPPDVVGDVAHWVDNNGPTHGSIQGSEHGPRWESKCGQDLKIQHDRDELNGETYGHISRYYVKQGGAPAVQAGSHPPEVPSEVKTAVRERALAVPEKVKEEFDKNYQDWQTFKNSPTVRMHANPALYCKTGAFDRIVAMGQDAVPLLMDKIAQGDFFSYQAFDAIEKAEPREEFNIAGAKRADAEAVSEQTRAINALLDWHQRV
jgi:hypothetical protein